nr:hypothetical protein P5640_07945 [Bacillus subtilis]
MIQVYEYDNNYLFTNLMIIEEYDDKDGYIIPENCTPISPPNSPSLYIPRFNKTKQVWEESASQEYINSVKLQPEKPSELDLLGQSLAEAKITILKNNKDILLMQQQIEDLKRTIFSND